jgi:hypothetical protein
MARQKTTWLDVYLNRFELYRRLRGGCWYKHEFKSDAREIGLSKGGTWWARYGEINRYSKVVEIYDYNDGYF